MVFSLPLQTLPIGSCHERSAKRRRRSSTACIVIKETRRIAGSSSTQLDDVNDDALSEILQRLPVDCVHRCKCVSKRWLSLISSSCFIRSYVQRRTKSPPLHRKCCVVLYFPIGHVVLSEGDPKESSPGIKLFDFNLSFLPVMQNPSSQSNKNIKILKVHNGLILCEARNFSSYQHYVCNPLTKQWVALPPMPWAGGLWPSGLGFICHYTSDKYDKVNIYLVMIQAEKAATATTFRVFIFSIQTCCWTKYDVACLEGSLSSSYWSRDTLSVCVHGEHLCWYAGSCIIMYSPTHNRHRCHKFAAPTSLANRRDLLVRRLTVDAQWMFMLYAAVTDGSAQYVWIWCYTDGSYQKPCMRYEGLIENASLGYLPGKRIYLVDPYNKSIYLTRNETYHTRTGFEIPKSAETNKFVCGEDVLYVESTWPMVIPQLPATDEIRGHR